METSNTRLNHLAASKIYVKQIKELIVGNDSIDDNIKKEVLLLYMFYNINYKKVEEKFKYNSSIFAECYEALKKIFSKCI